MSGERETWRPDAEPWEALDEAVDRAVIFPTLGMADCKSTVAALTKMGWELAPKLDHQCVRAEQRIEWLESELSAAKDRVAELHSEVAEQRAENERLREALNQIASCEKRTEGDVVDIARTALGKQPKGILHTLGQITTTSAGPVIESELRKAGEYVASQSAVSYHAPTPQRSSTRQ